MIGVIADMVVFLFQIILNQSLDIIDKTQNEAVIKSSNDIRIVSKETIVVQNHRKVRDVFAPVFEGNFEPAILL